MIVHLVSLLLCLDFLRVLCEQTPVIVFISPDQQKLIGDTVEFTCASTYHPAYSVLWMKGKDILTNNSLVNSKDSRLKIKHNFHNNSYTLNLENVQESDKGEYACVLLDKLKRISNFTKLNVLVEEIPSSFKPKFISKPINMTVKTGDTVILPCDVDDLGEDYVLLWKKDTSVLTAARLRISHNSRLELLDNWHLKITSILPEDEGTYSCQISTESPMELKHLVQLEAAPITSIVTASSDYVNEVIKTAGDELMLICQASGNPRPRIMWKKMNSRLPSGELSSSNPVLHIEAIHKEDSGFYICTASNGVGSDSSASFTLHVQFAPIVHTTKNKVVTAVGLTAQLRCEFEVFPSAQFTWFVNGAKIENQLHYSMSDESTETGKQISNLNITIKTQDDFGNYTCSGSNRFGTSKAIIEVTGLPAPVKILKGKTSSRPSNYHIDWTVQSYSPILSYKLRFRRVDKIDKEFSPWFERSIVAENRDGPDQLQTYDISELEPETTYQVVMNAENEYGWNSDSNILEFTTSSVKDSNVILLPPSAELDVADVQPEHSQQPGSAPTKNNQSPQNNSIYQLTIVMLVIFFWL